MALVFEVISEHKTTLRAGPEFSFGPQGGTIGRSAKNDWVLPDVERYLSGRHAAIDYRSGIFYLADLSRNGVFVNHSNEPLGAGNPYRLFDGDHVRMGSIEMLVHLDEGEDLEMPEDSRPSVAPDQVNALVPMDDALSSMLLLEEEEIAGDNAIDALLEESGEHAFLAENDPGEDCPPADEAVSQPVRRVRQNTDDELLNRFLVAAGIEPGSIDPSADPAAILTNAGEVLNELVAGLTELMGARANVKNMFRIEQTGVMPQLNNPIKLSASTSDTLKRLLVGEDGEFLGPLASVREACRDLRWHHDAVVAAMIKSFSDYVERLDPEQVAEHYVATHKRKPFLSSSAKRRYWEHFCDQYPVLTQLGNASLPQTYSEDFVQQYERQLADYARMESSLGETQTLRMPEGSLTNHLADSDAPETDVPLEDEIDEDLFDTIIDNRAAQ